jgi:hypothetical protein
MNDAILSTSAANAMSTPSEGGKTPTTQAQDGRPGVFIGQARLSQSSMAEPQNTNKVDMP